MDRDSALSVLGALAQGTRLDVFQLLARCKLDGLSAGDVARQLGVPQSTMSVHLGTLARAGLIQSERHSRHIIYRADHECLVALTLFLIEDCCGRKSKIKITPQKDVGV